MSRLQSVLILFSSKFFSGSDPAHGRLASEDSLGAFWLAADGVNSVESELETMGFKKVSLNSFLDCTGKRYKHHREDGTWVPHLLVFRCPILFSIDVTRNQMSISLVVP